jgi:chromosome segregation ATPase
MVQQYNTVRKENWALQADLSSLRSEVERLKGELDACETHVKIQARAIEEHHAKADAEVERLTQERDALALQVGQLREALADCGIHSVRCRTRKTLLAEDCNCGLSAALASSPTAPATPETNK